MLGAGGLLARRVARALVTSGHTVTVAGYHDEAHDSSGAPRRFIRLEDADALGSAVASHDAVINLEPVISDPRSALRAILDRPARRRRARQLTALTRALDGAPATRWIQRSTPALYRDGGDLWLTEDWPTSVNRATEHARSAEQAVREHVRRGGSGVVLRLARPYGPDDHWTHEILHLARKEWQPFDGPDPAFVPTISLADATAAVLAALDAAPGIYNVADPAPSTNSQLNVLAAAITGQEALHPSYPSYSAADRDLLRRSHRLDVTAFRTATGWNPRPGPSALAFIPSAWPCPNGDETMTSGPAFPLNRDQLRDTYPDLAGKVAVVTGGSRGIGAATARALAANGTAVAVVGRDHAAIWGTVQGIVAEGGTALGVAADCTVESDLATLHRKVADDLGPVDILAAFAGGNGMPVPTDAETGSHWREVIETDLTSVFLTVSACLP